MKEREPIAMILDEHESKSYQSSAGFRMWGGDARPPPSAPPLRWISFALIIGLAVVVGTWYALFQ